MGGLILRQLLTFYTTPVVNLDRFSLWMRDRRGQRDARNMLDAPAGSRE